MPKTTIEKQFGAEKKIKELKRELAAARHAAAAGRDIRSALEHRLKSASALIACLATQCGGGKDVVVSLDRIAAYDGSEVICKYDEKDNSFRFRVIAKGGIRQ